MSLRFKLDENLPRRICTSLKADGHDVETAISEGLAGAPDSQLLEASVSENRILVTLDQDFADIRTYTPDRHRGIWVLRPPEQSFETLQALVRSATRLAASQSPDGCLWIIGDHKIRIRE